ncbi:hypothetical protein [Veronia pacifica]|nr:hypothetical protein [Veronia pacifica]
MINSLSSKVFPAILLIAVLMSQACTSPMTNLMETHNGVIEWSSGTSEYVNVSLTAEYLTFVDRGFANQRHVVIYSRIDGASDARCEYYVNEPNPKARLTLCDDGEIKLIQGGNTLNVGRLKIFERS